MSYFQLVTWLAPVLVSKSNPQLKSNHCKSDLHTWKCFIFNHDVFSSPKAKEHRSWYTSLILGRQENIFPHWGRYTFHSCPWSRARATSIVLQCDIMQWGLDLGVDISLKKKITIGTKIAGFESWLYYLWTEFEQVIWHFKPVYSSV